jgi:hypothetical protein
MTVTFPCYLSSSSNQQMLSDPVIFGSVTPCGRRKGQRFFRIQGSSHNASGTMVPESSCCPEEGALSQTEGMLIPRRYRKMLTRAVAPNSTTNAAIDRARTVSGGTHDGALASNFISEVNVARIDRSNIRVVRSRSVLL